VKIKRFLLICILLIGSSFFMIARYNNYNERGSAFLIYLIDVKMIDKRWYMKERWIKRMQNVNDVEIHYVYNIKTGQVYDFKFKNYRISS